MTYDLRPARPRSRAFWAPWWPCFRGAGKVRAEGPLAAVLARACPGHVTARHPRHQLVTPACAVLVCRLRRQQGQSGQLLDAEGQAGGQARGQLRDGCNNSVLAHACSRGCSS